MFRRPIFTTAAAAAADELSIFARARGDGAPLCATPLSQIYIVSRWRRNWVSGAGGGGEDEQCTPERWRCFSLGSLWGNVGGGGGGGGACQELKSFQGCVRMYDAVAYAIFTQRVVEWDLFAPRWEKCAVYWFRLREYYITLTCFEIWVWVGYVWLDVWLVGWFMNWLFLFFVLCFILFYLLLLHGRPF